jgi:hypothetical protein
MKIRDEEELRNCSALKGSGSPPFSVPNSTSPPPLALASISEREGMDEREEVEVIAEDEGGREYEVQL